MPVMSRNGACVLFIHAPKAGGTSVEHAFRNAGWSLTYIDGRATKGSPNWYRWSSPQHMHADTLRATFRLDRFDAIFMTVRDPLARFRSEYLMRHPSGHPVDSTSVERWAHRQLMAYQSDPYTLDNHLRPQSSFYVPGCRVFRLEEGLEEISTLEEQVGVEMPKDFPHKLSRRQGAAVANADVQISDALRNTLCAFYAEDYHRFGYALPEQSGRR